jgi:hypothetical protein
VGHVACVNWTELNQDKIQRGCYDGGRNSWEFIEHKFTGVTFEVFMTMKR